MKKGFLLVISGPSGVGKGSVLSKLKNIQEDLVYSVSATTRAPRVGEREGINYFYKNFEEFNKMIEENEFLEYATVHNNLYGTPKEFVEKQINNGKIVILEIDVQGAMKVKNNSENGVYVFIAPPSLKELQRRIDNRGTEKKADVDVRMHNAIYELNYINEYDYLIINDHINTAIEQVNEIINAEKHRVSRSDYSIKE